MTHCGQPSFTAFKFHINTREVTTILFCLNRPSEPLHAPLVATFRPLVYVVKTACGKYKRLTFVGNPYVNEALN